MKRNRITELFDFESHGYKVGDFIGQGSFGKVFECKKLVEPEKLYALKLIQLSVDEE